MNDEVKILVTIEATLTKAQAGQLKRGGFSVSKNGTYRRLKIGDVLIGNKDAKITIEDDNVSSHTSPVT